METETIVQGNIWELDGGLDGNFILYMAKKKAYEFLYLSLPQRQWFDQFISS